MWGPGLVLRWLYILQECDLCMFFICVFLFTEGLISNVIALENTFSAAVPY